MATNRVTMAQLGNVVKRDVAAVKRISSSRVGLDRMFSGRAPAGLGFTDGDWLPLRERINASLEKWAGEPFTLEEVVFYNDKAVGEFAYHAWFKIPSNRRSLK